VTTKTDEPGGVAGLVTTLAPYRLTSSRMALAHSLIWSTSELHTRATMTDAGRPRSPMATGPWVTALISGLYIASGGPAALSAKGVLLGALIDVAITYHAPVYGDQMISVRSEVRSLEVSDEFPSEMLTIQDSCTDTEGRPLLTCVRRYHWSRSAA
jgi:acyl dehydratase